MYLLEKELGDLEGMSALVIGRSNLVGKPLAKMLLDANCTVTVAHSKTPKPYLEDLCYSVDIVVCAVGKPNFLDLTYCNGSIVVDVGINRDENGKLCGDCCGFEDDMYNWVNVTPVPGGVGLLTRAMLMQNVLDASAQLSDWKQNMIRTFLGGME
jgi:methylenetetrahydrofolate dehydrogenase (NADP+)/methenyltetrahydrofolate cyclohydrolase